MAIKTVSVGVRTQRDSTHVLVTFQLGGLHCQGGHQMLEYHPVLPWTLGIRHHSWEQGRQVQLMSLIGQDGAWISPQFLEPHGLRG